MNAPIPEPLAQAFRERVTISAPELCRLLPLDADTLRGHIQRGHIEYVQTGLGDRSPRKAFTLDAVLRFLEERKVRECPANELRVPRPTRLAPCRPEEGILALVAKRQAEKQRLKDSRRVLPPASPRDGV